MRRVGKPLAIVATLALVVLPAAWIGGCAIAPPPAAAPEARFPEHYAYSIAALGWPGAHRAFQVGHGSVVSTGEAALEWRLDPAAGPVTVSPVAFERDGVPVAHWTMEASGMRLAFEAAAAPMKALGDTGLVASVRVTAVAAGPGPAGVAFDLRLRSTPEGPHVLPWDAPERAGAIEAWSGHSAIRNGCVVAVVDPAAVIAAGGPTPGHPARTEGAGPGALAAHCSAHLAPGERRSWDFVLPLYPTALTGGELARGAGHERVTAAARRYWRSVLARAATLASPDSTVNAAWRAAIVTLVTCQELTEGGWAPIGSPFQYRDIWLRDGARAVRALALAGLHDFARGDALTLAQYELPTGALLSQTGQLDGTGQALWAFEQACAYADDRALAAGLLPTARRALGWIERQRRATVALAGRWPGLLPYADPRDAELVRAELVGNDAWAIAGCDAVASLAQRAGDRALAARAFAEAADYRLCFAAALVRTRSADVPPSWSGGGRDWGNLSAGYPTRALPLRDPRLVALARRVLAPAGRPGLSSYGPADSLHTYNGVDLALGEMLAGRPEFARAWRDSLFAHSSSTLGQAEIVNRRDGGFGANLPPHATAAAVLVDLLRSMVIADPGDTLEIALGGEARWWQGTTLANAPTRFGSTAVRLGGLTAGRLRVRLSPLSAPLRVRVPDGLRAVAVRSRGARITEPCWVEAPPRTTEVEFDVVRIAGATR